MKILPLLALLLLSPQDTDYAALAKKCGIQIPWINDPYEPFEGLQRPDERVEPPKVDRPALIDEAKKRAAAEKKLILVNLYRIEGRHMYRAPILDHYMNAVIWSDEEIVALVKDHFVPLRLYCDATVSPILGVKALDFVEPMIVVMDADGRKLQAIDRIRTFNADWVRAQLARHVKPAGPTGDAPLDKAMALRRERKGDEALAAIQDLDTPEAKAERGLILLRQGKLEDAKKPLEGALEGKRGAEAAYNLSLCAFLTGDEKRAQELWKDLAAKNAGESWGWKAAMNLATWKDTTPDGPVPHAFEDPFWAPADAYEPQTRTRLSRTEKDADEIAKRAVAWLLRNQRSNGSWNDTRYAYWDTPKILPNVRAAVTAIACAALTDWRDVDPKRIDEAVARGEKYILEDANFARGLNEECYAEGYKLLYLARKHSTTKDSARRGAAVKQMAEPVKRLELILKPDGLWAHEYPNPFATAAVLNCLLVARKEGAPVPDGMVKKAAEGLARQRGKDGGYTYSGGRKASGTKDSMARMPVCEYALYSCGLGSPDAVVDAMDNWWANYARFEVIRQCDFHSDGELAGFFFFHGFFHATETALVMRDKNRKEQLAKFLAELVKLPELDGSFIDDHEIGKSYGTAMALLSLRNCLRKK